LFSFILFAENDCFAKHDILQNKKDCFASILREFRGKPSQILASGQVILFGLPDLSEIQLK
jgi:hypothetical protein